MTKNRQWLVLTALGCAVVLVAGWFLLVSPQRSKATKIQAQTSAQQTSNDQLRTQISIRQQQAKNLPHQQVLLSELQSKIPSDPGLPSLIRQLSSAADSAGVDLASIAPGQPTLVTASGTGGTAATAAGASGLAQITVQIHVTGSYYNIEQFFSNVEGLNRSMLVTGFTLTPNTGGAASGSSAPASTTVIPLSATVTASVFLLPSTSASGTGQPAPTH